MATENKLSLFLCAYFALLESIEGDGTVGLGRLAGSVWRTVGSSWTHLGFPLTGVVQASQSFSPNSQKEASRSRCLENEGRRQILLLTFTV